MAKTNINAFCNLTPGKSAIVGHNRRVRMDTGPAGTILTCTYHATDIVTVTIPHGGAECKVVIDPAGYFTTSTMAAIKDFLELLFSGYAGVSRAKGRFSVSFAATDLDRDDHGPLAGFVGTHWLNHKFEEVAA